MKHLIRALALALLVATPASAQIAIPYTFSPGGTIVSSQVNANFSALANIALAKTGDTLAGNLTVSAGVTIDGADISAYLTGGRVFVSTAGLVGTPAISLTTDTNTGLYFPAADQLAIAVGGTQVLLATSSGNLVQVNALLIPNVNDIEWKDSGGTARTALRGTANNDLELHTLAAGKSIKVRNFTDLATLFQIDADTGNTTISGTLAVTGAITGASFPAASLTGSHTLPDGTLSTNVPLLNAVNTFTTTNKFTGTGTYIDAAIGIGGDYDTNADGTLFINNRGYQGGATRFRDLNIGTGKVGGMVLFTAALAADNGEFIANTFSLHVGSSSRVGRSITNSTNSINLYDGTLPSGTGSGFVTLTSSSGKLYVTDAAGNATKLSITGTGTPEGAVTAPIGTLFLRSDGGASTTLYVKESGAGNTGWVAK